MFRESLEGSRGLCMFTLLFLVSENIGLPASRLIVYFKIPRPLSGTQLIKVLFNWRRSASQAVSYLKIPVGATILHYLPERLRG